MSNSCLPPALLVPRQRVSGTAVKKLALSLALLALLPACGSGGGESGGKAAQEGTPPLVKVEPASPMRFSERFEAIGTAAANEQITLSAPVTGRILRLDFKDGSFVDRGQTIAVLGGVQQNGQLAEAQARAREAQQRLERIETLRARGFATKSSLEAQEAMAAQTRAQAQGAEALSGERAVTAPFAGWLSLGSASPGAVAEAGTEIGTISDIGTIKLDFQLPEAMLSAVQVGQTIEAQADAFADQSFRGRIANIDPLVDPNSRTVTIRARFPNPDRKLKPGMLLTVLIETASRSSLSVPELAVTQDGGASFVHVVGGDGIARRVEVRTGLRENGRVEILHGLKPGQQVVTEGDARLSDGMKVQIAGG